MSKSAGSKSFGKKKGNGQAMEELELGTREKTGRKNM